MATLDLGKIKHVWRGTYNNSTAYVVDDLVEYTDSGITSSYICVANSTGNAPSSSGTAHASWNYVAKGVVDPVPSQSGNSGKFLKTDGSALSFATAGKVFGINTSNAESINTSSANLIDVSIVASKANPTVHVLAQIACNVEPASSLDAKNVKMDLQWKLNSGSYVTFADDIYSTDVFAPGQDDTHNNEYDVESRHPCHKVATSGVSIGDTITVTVKFDAGGMGGNALYVNRAYNGAGQGSSWILAYEE